ncbi:shufflon system plasmid conjugative transfer pilus tip adhesin PilV [Klebsiella oxytoca]|uniref:shufflon system plasmid conjugative transfer pilus tip adhesin PilV n=1 Tax=Klebsiella oxytoca TaxID=571 RepID=UPI00115A261D|nr:shufflon system plasmid conjugative transfer pilus tip adhesin PilV [Klebsiella oxytoca]
MTFSRNQPARGINSLYASLAFVAIFAVMAVFLAMINDWQTERENQVIAQQTSRVADAAKKYIGDNYNSLSSAAPTTLTTATLVNAGYLNSTLAERNSASQTYAIGIRRMNNSGLLDALLVTLDGRVLTYKEMRSISASISGLGGYIEDGNTATGALGGWEVSLADYSLTSSAGHLAVALTADTLNGVNEESDRLYRFSVNGHPDYNRMHTDIDMNRSNLRDASDVSTTTLTADQQVSLATSGFFGWRRDSFGALATGFYYENDGSDWIRTVNNASLSTGGTLKGGTIQSEGMVIAGTYTMPGKTVTAGDACTASALGISGQISDTTGLIAHDSTGGTLSCQSGIWVHDSGVPSGTIVIWGSPAIPDGWFQCNGQPFNALLNPRLATLYPDGKVPDLRGVFLRGLDNGAGIDPDMNRALLSLQSESFKRHRHQVPLERLSGNVSAPGSVPGIAWPGSPQRQNTDTLSEEEGEDETRPVNKSVHYIIKGG